MKTVIVGNIENQWLMHGATNYGFENIPDFDPMFCYTPADVTKWAETLGKFVSTMDDDYFVLLLDDYWVQECDADLLARAERKMLEGVAAKIDLSGDRMKFPHTFCKDSHFVLSDQNARYRSSLQAAIWRKEYLMKLCQDGWTPWEFELKGEKVIRGDGEIVLGTSRPCLRYVNVLRRGKWHGRCDF